jgi:hypothetical protein
MTTATGITVRVPLAIRHRPGRKSVVTPMTDGVAPVTTRADPALLKALARAFRYQRMLDEGRYASITEMAAAETIDRGYLGRLLQLTLLSPDVVAAILDGQQPSHLNLAALMQLLPTEWARQRVGQQLPSSHKPPVPKGIHDGTDMVHSGAPPAGAGDSRGGSWARKQGSQ